MNNPQAFPSVSKVGYNEGMTLLDYFAGKALPALLEYYYTNKRSLIVEDKFKGYTIAEYVAHQAYLAAEVMLKEREKRLK